MGGYAQHHGHGSRTAATGPLPPCPSPPNWAAPPFFMAVLGCQAWGRASFGDVECPTGKREFPISKARTRAAHGLTGHHDGPGGRVHVQQKGALPSDSCARSGHSATAVIRRVCDSDVPNHAWFAGTILLLEEVLNSLIAQTLVNTYVYVKVPPNARDEEPRLHPDYDHEVRNSELKTISWVGSGYIDCARVL